MTINRIKTLSIPLLLAFIAFNYLHFSNILPHSHSSVKAIINVDDSKAKTFSDDEKKLPIGLQTLFQLSLILLTVSAPLIFWLVKLIRKKIFLIPIFHQSNYLILPPKS